VSEIITVSQNLPANIQELARFVLVGREKLVSVRAEIRAINKLNIAEEVRTQKKEEAMMLSEALLDAEVRIGELTRALPKLSGARTDIKPRPTTEERLSEKPKLQVIKNLGFNRQQVERFETLANNKDIVEQVKAEARENDDLPTRSRVLQLVKEKNQQPKQPDTATLRKSVIEIHDAITKASTVQTDTDKLSIWLETLSEEELNFNLLMLDDAIGNLRAIKAYITNPKNRR